MSSIDILEEAIRVQTAKAKDYGEDRERYFPFGHVSYLTMLIIKVERLKELMGRQAVHESAMDSVVDLINYASFYGDYLKRMEELDDEQLADGLSEHASSDVEQWSDRSREEWLRPIDIWGNPLDQRPADRELSLVDYTPDEPRWDLGGIRGVSEGTEDGC